MPLTHANIVDEVALQVWQTVNTTLTDALIISKMTSILKLLSKEVPHRTDYLHKSSYTFDGVTSDIILLAWDYDDLVRIQQEDGCEFNSSGYGADYERIFRNARLRGKTLSVVLDSVPASGKTLYIHPDRNHIVQAAIGTDDTAGALSADAAKAATSLALNLLGTGTINKYTKLTIAGDTTEYMVKATATIASAAATVTITPGLQAAALSAAVVTLALADSTLSAGLEEVFIKWVSGELIAEYSRHEISKLAIAAGWKEYLQLGQTMIAEAKVQLATLATAGRYIRHSGEV